MALERRTASLARPGRGGASAQAMARFAVLRPHLEEGVPLARAAGEAGVPLRTAQRWLARYRRDGLAGLARPVRSDAGAHRSPADLVALVEGLGLKRPRSSAAAIHRRVRDVAAAQGWRAPSYGTVHAILARLDPAMVTLAQDGAAAYRDRYELIHRHRAGAPNALWQADHTLLDILVLDEGGKPAGPWLTTVLDDHSRAVAGYMVFLGAPSVLNTCLALRQAIWRKADPAWPVCGIPDVLYVDHGSDFTSRHLDQVAAELRFRVVYSAVGRPQGRGKVERLFGTLNTELLPELPGHLVGGQAGHRAPACRWRELDRGDRRLHRRHLPRPRPRRDRRDAARRLARRRLPAAPAREPGGARPAAGHARQAAPRAARRHPLPGPALRRPDARRPTSARRSPSATIRATCPRSGSSTATGSSAAR